MKSVSPLLIGLVCLLIYNINGRAVSAGDTYPSRYLPFAIWHNHTILLDPIASLTAQGRQGLNAFWIQRTPSGHFISLYPVVLPVLIAPLYLPAVAYLHVHHWTDAALDHTARVMEKLTASLLAALSASLLYLLLRRRAAEPIALILTAAYAFGTTTWMIGSQALWMHGIAELLVVGALLLLTAPCNTPRALAAGLLCGLIASNRPPDTILAAALGAYGLWWAGRRAPLLVVAAALPMSLVLLYNLRVTSNVAGGYGLIGKPNYFRHELFAGVAGLLFSPTRGLFVFSPFLLFLVFAWRHRPHDRGERLLSLAMCAGIVLQLALYAKADWRGGISWGARYMTDVLPMLVWMLVPVVAALRGLGATLFLLAVGASIVIEAIGAFWYTGVTDLAIYAVNTGPDELRVRAAWDWRNAPFIASLHKGLAPPELTIEMRGNLDTIEANGHPTLVATAGDSVVATGWALAGHATPWQAAVVLDYQQVFATQTFADRPDLRRALHEPSPAGWRISFSTRGLAPGDHDVAAFVWASDRGESYFLTHRTLTIQSGPAASLRTSSAATKTDAAPPAQRAPGEDLTAAARTAATRLRTHQQGPGYWLTAYTATPRFEQPHEEMNTFLTSLLIDLLDPLAAANGLNDTLQRARQHLTSQIEADGLVRYHGRPDAPTIGTLGCAITPDADDTALVWRLASDHKDHSARTNGTDGTNGTDDAEHAGRTNRSDRNAQRLAAALATLERYRTSEGLYRTWLAPRAAYQCIDPGADPDPTDIAIQMHVLQFLANEQPPAARKLCDALRKVGDQDRIWVYYRITPLVPILRVADLERVGCDLKLPESRMQTSVPGQEIWLSTVRLLNRAVIHGAAPTLATAPPEGEGASEILTLLRRLAADDFALVRKSPPLLYHNDLSATVPRYYWSEDVGYALWLRLADERAHLMHPDRGVHPSPGG